VKDKKPKVGDLVRILQDYSKDQYDLEGELALVTKTLGIECVVTPVGGRGYFWFARRLLGVVNESR